MSHGYKDGLTLDRVNNNAGYNPGNVRWISRKAQARNRTTNTYLTIDGRSRPMVEWCEMYGIADYVVVKRLNAGWSVKDAVTTPLRTRRKRRCSEDICMSKG